MTIALVILCSMFSVCLNLGRNHGKLMFSMCLSRTTGQKQSDGKRTNRDEHQPNPSATVQGHRSVYPDFSFQLSCRADDVLNARQRQGFDRRHLAERTLKRDHVQQSARVLRCGCVANFELRLTSTQVSQSVPVE
ncbi:hypothetical protein [Ruegeria atlantica]|uniref:hypothetical protein n=1 Tax=Ruegeria atlantica TaxID=81569 RepID=UPI00147E8BFA|nr:hypothetical protein [Ruegeria atlantica]